MNPMMHSTLAFNTPFRSHTVNSSINRTGDTQASGLGYQNDGFFKSIQAAPIRFGKLSELTTKELFNHVFVEPNPEELTDFAWLYLEGFSNRRNWEINPDHIQTIWKENPSDTGWGNFWGNNPLLLKETNSFTSGKSATYKHTWLEALLGPIPQITGGKRTENGWSTMDTDTQATLLKTLLEKAPDSVIREPNPKTGRNLLMQAAIEGTKPEFLKLILAEAKKRDLLYSLLVDKNEKEPYFNYRGDQDEKLKTLPQYFYQRLSLSNMHANLSRTDAYENLKLIYSAAEEYFESASKLPTSYKKVANALWSDIPNMQERWPYSNFNREDFKPYGGY